MIKKVIQYGDIYSERSQWGFAIKKHGKILIEVRWNNAEDAMMFKITTYDLAEFHIDELQAFSKEIEDLAQRRDDWESGAILRRR